MPLKTTAEDPLYPAFTIGISNLFAKNSNCSMAAARKVSAAITPGFKSFVENSE